MYRIHFYITFLLVALTTVIEAKEFSRQIHSALPTSGVEKVKISNKFGNIHIHESASDSTRILVSFTTNDISERNADLFFKSLNVAESINNGVYSFITQIDELKGPRREFSVNYEVYLPSSIEIDVKSKYGDIRMDNLNTKGSISVMYGNLIANDLICEDSPISIKLDYARANIRKLDNAILALNYSTFAIDSAETITLNSKYSTFTVTSVNKISASGKGGRFIGTEVGNLTAKGSHINYDIDCVKHALNVSNSYGHINIGTISQNFSSIHVDNSYGNILLDLEDEAIYNLEFKGKYSEVLVPNERGMTRNNSNEELSMYGVSNGIAQSANKQVKITSKYGRVTL